jgi:Rrf2 family protein
LIDKRYLSGNNTKSVHNKGTMITIRRDTDYAVRVVLHLSMLGEGARITAEEVAAQRLLPRAFVRRIIGRLGAAGLLRTVRGAGGGIALSRPASEVSLLDVVAAMEGGFALNCCVDDPKACPLTKDCPVRRSWITVSNQIAGSLGAIRFDHLAKVSNRSRRQARTYKGGRPANKQGKKKKGDGRGRG